MPSLLVICPPLANLSPTSVSLFSYIFSPSALFKLLTAQRQHIGPFVYLMFSSTYSKGKDQGQGSIICMHEQEFT